MDKKNLKTTVDDFLKESNDTKKQEECTTQECRMKNGEDLLERIDKKLITKDGKELLIG